MQQPKCSGEYGYEKHKKLKVRNEGFQMDPYLPKESKANKQICCNLKCMKKKHTSKKKAKHKHKLV